MYMGSLSKGGTIALAVVSGVALVAVVLELVYLLWSRRWQPDLENGGGGGQKRYSADQEMNNNMEGGDRVLSWRRSRTNSATTSHMSTHTHMTHWGLLGVLFAIKEESGDELGDSDDGKAPKPPNQQQQQRHHHHQYHEKKKCPVPPVPTSKTTTTTIDQVDDDSGGGGGSPSSSTSTTAGTTPPFITPPASPTPGSPPSTTPVDDAADAV